MCIDLKLVQYDHNRYLLPLAVVPVAEVVYSRLVAGVSSCARYHMSAPSCGVRRSGEVGVGILIL